jgi:hypothetical protein
MVGGQSQKTLPCILAQGLVSSALRTGWLFFYRASSLNSFIFLSLQASNARQLFMP